MSDGIVNKNYNLCNISNPTLTQNDRLAQRKTFGGLRGPLCLTKTSVKKFKYCMAYSIGFVNAKEW